ncbi:MAG: Lrp/AsnC ligand binding domain-containing protein [Methanomassiliicoccales archaeon]
MPSAIILINTEVGKEGEVMTALSNIQGVSEVYLVYGVYDIVSKIESDRMEDLEAIISNQIRKITGIRSTLTLIISRKGKGNHG